MSLRGTYIQCKWLWRHSVSSWEHFSNCILGLPFISIIIKPINTQKGETIEKKAECQTCTCQDAGEMTCQEKVCPTLNCKEDHQLEARNDDECCSYCKSISCKSTDLKQIVHIIQYSNENKKELTSWSNTLGESLYTYKLTILISQLMAVGATLKTGRTVL